MTNSLDPHTYVTTEEVAAFFRVPASTVRYWRATGTGPKVAIKPGKRVLYSIAEVLRWDKELQAAETARNRGRDA